MADLLAPPNAKIVLPPHGFVALQKSCASDLDVVNAARVSLANESDWLNAGPPMMGWNPEEGKLAPADAGLLRYLLKSQHGSPFEHNFFKWHVRLPIFVAREWHRHRIGWSYNEESARYTELRPDFYIPQDDAWRTQVGKPGRYTYEPVSKHLRTTHEIYLRGNYGMAFEHYKEMLAEGIAKEIARTVLPVGVYTQMIASCNARSLMNFIALRNAPTALREIRVYAQAMEDVLAEVMPVTHAAFVENGRIAP